MATQFKIDNALMAGRAYFDTRTSVNRFPVPNGWTEFFHVPNPAFSVTGGNGFEAVSFRRGSEIVISFAGTDFTDFTGDWFEANVPLAVGELGTQLVDAARYYLEVKAANPTATISFTGHSLGGGLAALMAVFFDEQAITFDQAPFAAAANDTVRAELELWLNAYGYSDAMLTSLAPEFMSYSEGTRTDNVTGYYVQGDALAVLQDNTSFEILGTQTMLPQNSTGLGLLGSVDLHSQTLLTAFLLNEDLRAITFELPDLLKTLFDKGLYAEDTATGERNFLDNLLRHQIGVAADPIAGVAAIPADGMLDRFVIDIQKLTPDTYGMASGTGMSEALVVAAMEYHYFKDAASATQLFTFADYGPHFKYSDIGASSYKSLPKLVTAVNAFLSPEELALLNGRLVKQDAWHIQSGVGGMIVHAGADNDAMIGGANSDGLWAGAGSDILIGGANNDVLAGEAGNDYLLGGIGFDTYLINVGDGYDTILDSDGQGVINIGGIEAKGSAGLDPTKWKQLGTDTWADTQNNIVYTKSIVDGETQLLIIKGNSAVVVKGWTDGELGIELGVAAPETQPATTATSNGTTNQDFLIGGSANDLIQGQTSIDYLSGGGGDDVIEGGDGNDVIAGGSTSDNDTLRGGEGDDLILGDGVVAVANGDLSYLTQNNLLTGIQTTIDAEGFISYTYAQPNNVSVGASYAPGGNDTIYGELGNDVVEAGGGSDSVEGGDGADLISGDGGQDILLGQADNDILLGDAITDSTTYGDDFLSGGDGNDRIWGAGGNDYLIGGSGDDYLHGDGNRDTTHDGADVLDGGTGNDSLIGGGGDDLLFGGSGNDVLDGGDGNDYLDGGEGSDTLYGRAGNDTLIGEAGDTLNGGEGDDTYIINGQVSVEIYDNDGRNTLILTDVASVNASMLSIVNGRDNVEAIRLDLGEGQSIQFTSNFGTSITIQAQDGSELDLEKWATENVTQNLKLYLGEDGSFLRGGAGNDKLFGGAGVDYLYGNAGGDSLWGVEGDDFLYGGPGNDYFLAGSGEDLLDGGDGSDTLYGDEGNDLVMSGAGNDTLRGMDGVDTVMGGSGDDIYVLLSSYDINDTLIEEEDEGIDTVDAFGLSYTLGNHFENLYLKGSNGATDIDGTGNDLDNLIGGTSGNNILAGGGGNDTLHGESGVDTLIGGAGDDYLDGGYINNGGDGVGDTLIGGDGNDKYEVRDAIDSVIEAQGEGSDTVYSFLNSYTLPENIEALVVIDAIDAAGNGTSFDAAAIGNSLDNVIIGNDKANFLQGNDGADHLYGNKGNDTLIGGTGRDYLIGGAGNDLLEGGEDGDTLSGDDGNDVLHGQGGDDLINGGAGADLMLGGLGDDRYLVDDAGDVVTEYANEGTDVVASLIASFVLPEQVENLEILSVGIGITGTGNALNNEIHGNSADNMVYGLDGADSLYGMEGNDLLDGGIGADRLDGGVGDDVYVVDENADVVVELANGGTDAVYSSVSKTLEASVENLFLTGDLAIDGFGNDLGNTLVGNNAANILQGGAGDDNYVVGPGDSVVELASGGNDTVHASMSYTLDNNVENLTLAGTAAIDATGNELNNVLTGNVAANKLTGGDGDDTYVIGAGDTLVERHNAGQDTIVSYVSYALENNLENLVLAGTEAISGTGNSLNNHLFGNTQDNILIGGRGDDMLEGGGGTDALDGGAGNDIYVFGRGDGMDLITDFQKKSNTDILSLAPDIAAEQIWFRQAGNDLEMSIIGTQDSITIKDWYAGSAYHVEQFTLANGEVLLDSQVQALVDAMASFAPPAAGQTTLPQSYQDALAGVIGVNWQ